jgi:Leishmanolysin/Bacterial pre-peptidase C-terminal domain/Bacterial Ig-like domain
MGEHWFWKLRQIAGKMRPTRRLRFESLEDRRVLAPVADIIDISPDPRSTPVGDVTISFTEPVTGLDAGDFTLTLNGNPDPGIAGLPVNGSGATYTINLSSLTTSSGHYELRLNALNSGIVNANQELLEDDASDTWDTDTTAPTADIVDVTPDPRGTAVGDVAITFTQPVTGVDTADFHLTRNGVNVSLAALTVTGAADSYSLNLTTVTALPGTYVFTLIASGSGITGANNKVILENASDTWVNSALTADIVDVTPDPRNTAVGDVAINFSESVTGVNTADFTLTRNGTAVSLAALTVNGSGANYTLNLSTVTATVGTYVFTLVATGSGITDADNNALSANASDTFVVEVTPPTADIVDVTPDPRQTPVGVVTILFSESVTGVDIADLTLVRNGVAVSLAGLTVGGSGATYTLNLTTVTAPFGSYVLTLVAPNSGIKDLAGNALTANASDSWSIDDTQEDNDTLRTAKFLGKPNGPLTISGLGLVDSNDWYSFSLASKGGPNDKVAISFQHSQGDLDLQLYNVSGTKIKSSTGVTDGEQISLNGLAAGTYYIRVFGKNNASNPNYSLTIIVPVKLTDDLFEENDTRTAARALGTLTALKTVPNLVMADAHDWYRFITTSTGTGADFVQIDFLNSQGNLDLELYNASGTRLASSTGTTDNQNISLSGRAAGTYFVHVFGVGGVQNPNYTLTIDPPAAIVPPTDTTFSVQFNFQGLTVSQVAVFQQAAQKWQSIITGDLPNAIYFQTGFTSSVVVDDLFIDAIAKPIDGVGNVLGGSIPDAFRPTSTLASSGLPYHGIMEFDTADLATLEATGTLLSVVEHEMAHVLGFGAIWASKSLILGAGTANARFVGPQAIAAYNAIFNTTATSVPVDNTGIEGTADAHWRESVLGNELMTGFLGPGTTNPLSIITIASMADLGYTVNLAAADPYTASSAFSLLAVLSGPDTTSGSASLIAAPLAPIRQPLVAMRRSNVDLAAALSARQLNTTTSPLTQNTSTLAVDHLLADWLSLSNELTRPLAIG